MVSTTGFITADFDLWPSFAKILLFALLFVGGCVGSTSGSIKAMRIYVTLKSIWIEALRLIHPNIVKNIKIEKEVILSENVRKMMVYVLLYLITFGVGSVIMCFYGLDMVSAMTATATTIAGCGPGMEKVGPIETYSFLSNGAKLFLSLFMFIGRLEIFAFLLLFTRSFWKS